MLVRRSNSSEAGTVRHRRAKLDTVTTMQGITPWGASATLNALPPHAQNTLGTFTMLMSRISMVPDVYCGWTCGELFSVVC